MELSWNTILATLIVAFVIAVEEKVVNEAQNDDYEFPRNPHVDNL